MINVANLTPEMIDAAVIQLRMVMEHAEGIPDKVRASGTEFVNDLDNWSTEMKAKKNGNG
jgi:hypothetical protein